MNTDVVSDSEPWFGLEQEYSLVDHTNRPIGWPSHFMPRREGDRSNGLRQMRGLRRGFFFCLNRRKRFLSQLEPLNSKHSAVDKMHIEVPSRDVMKSTILNHNAVGCPSSGPSTETNKVQGHKRYSPQALGILLLVHLTQIQAQTFPVQPSAATLFGHGLNPQVEPIEAMAGQTVVPPTHQHPNVVSNLTKIHQSGMKGVASAQTTFTKNVTSTQHSQPLQPVFSNHSPTALEPPETPEVLLKSGHPHLIQTRAIAWTPGMSSPGAATQDSVYPHQQLQQSSPQHTHQAQSSSSVVSNHNESPPQGEVPQPQVSGYPVPTTYVNPPPYYPPSPHPYTHAASSYQAHHYLPPTTGFHRPLGSYYPGYYPQPSYNVVPLVPAVPAPPVIHIQPPFHQSLDSKLRSLFPGTDTNTGMSSVSSASSQTVAQYLQGGMLSEGGMQSQSFIANQKQRFQEVFRTLGLSLGLDPRGQTILTGSGLSTPISLPKDLPMTTLLDRLKDIQSQEQRHVYSKHQELRKQQQELVQNQKLNIQKQREQLTSFQSQLDAQERMFSDISPLVKESRQSVIKEEMTDTSGHGTQGSRSAPISSHQHVSSTDIGSSVNRKSSYGVADSLRHGVKEQFSEQNRNHIVGRNVFFIGGMPKVGLPRSNSISRSHIVSSSREPTTSRYNDRSFGDTSGGVAVPDGVYARNTETQKSKLLRSEVMATEQRGMNQAGGFIQTAAHFRQGSKKPVSIGLNIRIVPDKQQGYRSSTTGRFLSSSSSSNGYRTIGGIGAGGAYLRLNYQPSRSVEHVHTWPLVR